MDRAEQVAFSTSTKTYIEQMKLRPLFYSLTKLLCEAKPADPISTGALTHRIPHRASGRLETQETDLYNGLPVSAVFGDELQRRQQVQFQTD